MFQILAERLQDTFSSLRGRGHLSEADVDEALREIRRALLEADVALPVSKALLTAVKDKVVGSDALKSVKPGEQVVKAVYDALVESLGEPVAFDVKAQAPAVLLMCGLQGSGKTTSTAKLAKFLQETQKKSVMLVSLDIYRPAAQLQLQQLSERIGCPMLDIREGEKPVAIAKRALEHAKAEAVDVLILDTAGRLEIDETLMQELVEVQAVAKPAMSLLVVDALTGQSAVQVAETFKQQIDISGLIFTRIDGDGRGGAVLSVRQQTGVPIYFLGAGEGVDALEVYRPEGLAGRILGQGDVVALVEKVQAATEGEDTAGMEAKLLSGQGFDLNDLLKQFRMMQRLGGLGGLMKFMPGMGKLKDAINGDAINEKAMKRQMAIIQSMTKQERVNPNILNARRRQRIAKGSGMQVSDVNKLLKMHAQMNKMTKMFGKNPAALKNLMQGMGKGGPF